MSYILPYSLMGACGGLLASIATQKFVFFPVFTVAGAAMGSIRNNNTQRADEKIDNKGAVVELANIGLKGLFIWCFGTPILLLGGLATLLIMAR